VYSPRERAGFDLLRDQYPVRACGIDEKANELEVRNNLVREFN
jgi:hypothetical protein